MAEDIVGRLVYLITGDQSGLDKALKTSSRKMQDAGKAMQRMGKRLTMGLTLPIAAAGIAALKFAADIETQQVAFATLLGDVERGTKLFEDLKKFSAETPLQLKDITQGAQKLLAFGTASEDVQDRLRMLGDLAMGNAQKLGSMVTAFGKIQTRGKATMEELNMVIDAGVPILAALAQGFGVSQEKLFEMVSAGEVKFPDFQKALEDMTGVGGQFEGMMSNIAETTSGKFSTAVDNVKLAAADLVESLLPIVNDVLAAVTEGAQAFAAMDEGTKRTILSIAGIAVVAGPAIMIVGRLVSVIGILRNAFIVARTATLAFSASLNVNPIFLVISAAAALTLGIIALVKRLKGAKKEAKETTDEFDEYDKALKRVNVSQINLAETRAFMEKGAERFHKLQKLTAELEELKAKKTALYGSELRKNVFLLRDAMVVIDAEIAAVEEKIAAMDRRVEKTEETEGEETDIIITESELRRRRWEDDLDFQIDLEEQRLTQLAEAKEREKEIQAAADEYKRELREQEAEEERELNQLKLSFASDMATATGDVVSGMFERMSQAAEGNEKVQKQIARAQAIAGKAFALFQAIISTKAAIANAMATPPFSLLRVAFATATGIAQIAAIIAKPIPKFARGINFVVPPGFENDTFPMMAETGEHVEITPKDEVAAGGAGELFHITVNFAGKTFYDEITRATRNRQIIIDAGALHES